MLRTLVVLLLLACGIAQANVPAAAAEEAPRPVNINTASAAEIDASLINIGPKRAQRIVEYRGYHGPFKQPEDVMEVPYIGPRLFEANQPFIRVN
nr:helix-hairpin-helix domain-containing protein [Oceanococcus sp. HetDA_MAG_MS8]